MTQCCEPGSGAGNLPDPSVRDDDAINGGTTDLPHPTVDITRSPCSSDRAVIEVQQSQPAVLRLYVADRNGAPVDITNLPDGTQIQFVVKDTANTNTARVARLCTIVTAATGIVQCELTKADTKSAGIFVAQVVVMAPDNNVLWATPYWMMVNFTLNFMSTGPITIPEVRLILRDSCPEQNILLDDFEFNDSQIVACMRLPIDEFNEKYQPKTRYVPRTFPFRYHWLRATCGYLLEIAARGYARDRLAYNAGGVAIDDKNKMQDYMLLGKDLLTEWRQFIKERKIEMNIEQGWGSVQSYYGYNNW